MNIETKHIIAYLEGKLSKEETVAFENKMLHSPELRKETDDLRFICDTSRILQIQEQINVEKRWKNISGTLKMNRYRKNIGRFLRYAAAILVIPALISSLYFYQQLDSWKAQHVEQVETKNACGLISKITLPDGSEVWLNSGSELRYPKYFTDKQRKVFLSGEAYFKVSSDKQHRFDVDLSNGLTVSAYGTEFNISSYADDDEICTTLATGMVEIRNDRQPIPRVLNPGEQASYNKITNNMQVADVNLYLATAWKDGKMVFRRTSMVDVAQRLSRHFNVHIQLVSETIHNYKYSATFTNETLDDILNLLEKTAPIKCTTIEPEQDKDFSFTQKTIIIEAR